MPDYQAQARQIARKYKLPEAVFASLVQHESGWDAAIKSPAGAIGLTQLMPGTARSLGVNPLDPLQNLDGGARYLRAQLDKFGRLDLALAAYNAGPGAVEKYGGIPPYRETRHYVRNIMASSSASTATAPAMKQQSKVTGPASFRSISPVPAAAVPSTLVADTAFSNLGKIAQGWKPTDTLGDLVSASQTPAPVSARPSPSPAASPAPQPSGGGGKRTPLSAKAGSPVPTSALTSIGAEHETAGLAGYPAHDYFGDAGAPVVAPVGGTIVRFSGHDPKGGPVSGVHGPFGWSLYLQGNDGRMYYLTHMGSRSVRPGQKVAAGSRLGTIGDYAQFGGSNHVHMGVS